MKSSGWMNTDAVNLVECPRCRSSPGEDCRTPNGRRVFSPHGERITALHWLNYKTLILKIINDETERSRDMEIEWYAKARTNNTIIGDFARVSTDKLKFSKEVLKNSFKNATHIRIGYSATESAIYLRPVDNDGGLKIGFSKDSKIPFIQWNNFMKQFNLILDKPVSIKLQPVSDKNMWKLCLKALQTNEGKDG